MMVIKIYGAVAVKYTTWKTERVQKTIEIFLSIENMKANLLELTRDAG